MNESKKYAFKLSGGLINYKKPNSEPVINRSWLVAAKSARPEISSTGRSEGVKVTATFQKLRLLMFER